jgi:hypothetical protein
MGASKRQSIRWMQPSPSNQHICIPEIMRTINRSQSRAQCQEVSFSKKFSSSKCFEAKKYPLMDVEDHGIGHVRQEMLGSPN